MDANTNSSCLDIYPYTVQIVGTYPPSLGLSVKWCCFSENIVRDSCCVELASLRKEEARKKINNFNRQFAYFWFGTFTVLFDAARRLVDHENT